MAAPQVTATAALLLSLEPTLTPAQIRTRLAATAVDGGPAGYDDYYGFGVLDVERALAANLDDGKR
jgi:subtilisin family serine protease